jgi:hypothetical protein
MSTNTYPVLLVVAAALATSCGHIASYQNSDPIRTPSGIEVAAAATSCYVNRTADPLPRSTADEGANVALAVEVKNASPRAVVVDPGVFRLTGFSPAAAGDLTPGPTHTVVVNPDESKKFSVEFHREGDIDCRQPFALDPGTAVRIDGTAVHLASIQFKEAR